MAEGLPRALYTARQAQDFDHLAITQYGVSGERLMQRAGEAAFVLLRSLWPTANRLVILTGTGNNAGDGFVLAGVARQAGLEVRVLQLGDRQRLRGDALLFARRWEAMGGHWQDYQGLPGDADLLVDALLGTGLRGPVAGVWRGVIGAVNAHLAPCLSLDLPSGLNADTGEVMGDAVRATATLCYVALKLGLFTGSGREYAGDIHFDSLAIPARVYASSLPAARRLDWGKQARLLGPRLRHAHKGHFGRVLVVAGNHGMGGAGLIAAEAALRSGAGLTSLATRCEHVGAALARCPELMVHGVESAAHLQALLSAADVVVAGPGLGRDAWAQTLWEAVSASGRPLVVDADALQLLAADPVRRDNWLLTPHPGEAARLLGVCVAEINADRLEAVLRIQRRFGGTAVLKGSGSLVASDGTVPAALCSDGNPGMASGGMGDALSGILGALLAQGLSLRDAAEAGVCLHAAAGDAAARAGGERGMLASDLIARLRGLVNP